MLWEDAHGTPVIKDDAGNAYATQNSQNYAFCQSLIDTDPHTHGIQTGPIGPASTFDIGEQIVDPHHQVVADTPLDVGSRIVRLYVSGLAVPATVLPVLGPRNDGRVSGRGGRK